MKNIVIFDDYHMRDLKPPELLKRYLELTERDVREMLVPAATVEVPCPGCGSDEAAEAFEKFGMTYRECSACGSLYVSPRPDDAALARYDADSEARRYWRETLAPGSGAARHEKIVKPRSEWIVDSTREHMPGARALADISTAQAGYVAELAGEGAFERIVLVDPVVEPPVDAVGVTVARGGSPDGGVDVVTLLEVADRTSDVDGLFARVAGMLQPGGLVFATAVLASGFDIQSLWDHAENIYPPDRLNVLSADGLRALARRCGFEALEFSTPGILDVEIVAATLERDPSAPVPRWVRLLLTRDEHARRAFQQFLQAELLSSYGRVVLKRA